MREHWVGIQINNEVKMNSPIIRYSDPNNNTQSPMVPEYVWNHVHAAFWLARLMSWSLDNNSVYNALLDIKLTVFSDDQYNQNWPLPAKKAFQKLTEIEVDYFFCQNYEASQVASFVKNKLFEMVPENPEIDFNTVCAEVL